jgi:ketosteroid isomerase-like protein
MAASEAILDANQSFYRAFESLALDRMEKVWLRDPRIVCIHPGWPKLSGWGPVMASWERIFENVFEMKFDLSIIDVRFDGDLGLAVTEEHLTQRNYDGALSTRVLSTNVFEQVGNQWLLVLHHGSPVMAPPDDRSVLQ